MGNLEQKKGTIGQKIKRLRTINNMTQKELGLKCGAGNQTAESQISQYERNLKMPRKAAIDEIAQALNANPIAFYEINLFEEEQMQHALFDIGDGHGLHPVEINGQIYLGFGGKKLDGTEGDVDSYQAFLHDWLVAYQKYMTSSDHAEYMKWCFGYGLKNKQD